MQENLQNQMRNVIQEIVSSIKPFDPLEKEHLDRARHWIDSGAKLFRIAKPATPDTHLVSYFVLFDQAQQKILLVDHKKSGLWLPAGGHVEIDEHPKETVQRELKEELFLDADFFFDAPLFLTVTKIEDQAHTDVSFWYVLKADSTSSIDFDPREFHGIRWFSLDALPYERTDPHMARFIQKLCMNIH